MANKPMTLNFKQMNRKSAAFTLIEMLVVIAIMGILAGLIITGASWAAENSKRKRVEGELRLLETAIESYESKLNFYPPDNKSNVAEPVRTALHPLFHELAGATVSGANYSLLNGGHDVTTNQLITAFNRKGIANSNPETAQNFLATGAERLKLITNAGIIHIVVPVEGPVPAGVIANTWRYNSSKPVHNPKKFDLWAEVIIRGKTNIIGNWKD